MFTNQQFIAGANEYKIFICSGDMESGAYTHTADSYAEAAKKFGFHANRVRLSSKYVGGWRYVGRKAGNPINHVYMQDVAGNKILIIKTFKI